ncbi:MAG: phosphoglycerate dehydrogenase [Phycisphaerales bacterium]|nr:MAG: phosphoglycerate dehydrogenase [Phycisphaerales bacterium]
MRILIADKLAPEGLAYLESQEGVDVEVRLGLTPDELPQALRSAEGLVVRSGVRVTGDALRAAFAQPGARLKAIARAGVGVDNIDLDAATEFGVMVMNSASASTITTAEHAFALLMAMARNIPQGDAAMRSGGWDRNKHVGVQLHGRTLGVVGLGRIGQTVAERALAFGMDVLGYDPYIKSDHVLDGRVPMATDWHDFLSRIDAVSFHVPLNDHTRNMLGREAFAHTRPHLLIINAARGGVVDEEHLPTALDEGRCAGAALDVFTTEPPPADSPLRTHPKIICTPHLGASTSEAQEAVSVDACRAIVEYLRGEGVRGAVNAGGVRFDLSPRQRAYIDLATRMARLAVALCDAPPATLSIHAVGEELTGATDTLGRIALAETLSAAMDDPVNLVNASVVARRRGLEFHNTHETSDDGAPARLAIEIETGRGVQRAEGVVLQDGLPRLRSIDGCAVDLVPTGHVVALRNRDEPGVIGRVGAVFGGAGVNIADMTICRRKPGEGEAPSALMLIRLDAPAPREVLDALRGLPALLGVASVELGPLPE